MESTRPPIAGASAGCFAERNVRLFQEMDDKGDGWGYCAFGTGGSRGSGYADDPFGWSLVFAARSALITQRPNG